MVICCIMGCNNQTGVRRSESKVEGRHFLRFHRFPKDKAMRKRWTARTQRKPTFIHPHTMRVCSDHFCDADYKESSFLRSKLRYSERMQIHLKSDAVPNTDRATGALAIRGLRANKTGGSMKGSGRKLPTRRVLPLDIAVDAAIRENEAVTGLLYDEVTSSDTMHTEVYIEVPSDVPGEVFSEVSTELPSEVYTEMPSAMYTEVASEVPAEFSTEMPAEVSTDVPAEVYTEVPATTINHLEDCSSSYLNVGFHFYAFSIGCLRTPAIFNLFILYG